MPNPLDPIWDAYLTAQAASKVVRRCLTIAGVDRAKSISNTRFYGLTDQECFDLLDRSQAESNDATVLALYASFESRLRDHVLQQALHLRAAQQPSPAFGAALADSFADYCGRNRMDDIAQLFLSAVGPILVAQVGNIRVYRHWLAHGRAWAQPPNVTPQFTYQTLTAYLQTCDLV